MIVTDTQLAELFVQAQRVEAALIAAEREAVTQGGEELKEIRDAKRHATVTRLSLGHWMTARQARVVAAK